jgi:NADH-quinone oxidoreductase subunit H
VNLELGPLLHQFFEAGRNWAVAHGMPPWGARLLSLTIQTNIVVWMVPLVPLILVYMERKVSASMQARIGPNRTGPFGLLQTLADGVKLMFKADIVPDGADRWLHLIAPIVVAVPAFVCFAPLPMGKSLVPVDMDIGILFIFAVSGVSTIGILIAGWASSNKYSMLGGLRGAAQLVSYEIPRLLSVVPAVMFYRSQSLRVIAEAQQTRIFDYLPKWFIFYPFGFISFILFLICSVAETNRVPFDIPEAESELVAGFHTEFSGFKFSLFFLAEYAYVFVAAAMTVAIFLGGGDGITFPQGITVSWIWFLLKTFVIIFIFMWFRWTYPRLRVDRLMQFCWQFLLPLSFVNIFLTAGWILWRG